MLNIVAQTHNFKPVAPEVGMGASEFVGSDRYPYSVVSIVSPRECVVRLHGYKADPTKEGGMGHQNWVVADQPSGQPRTVTLRKDGKWRIKGLRTRRNDSFFLLGRQEVYYCWEF